MRTQLAIVGAGPAGLLLSHLLHQSGIESVVLERHSRSYVERRIRAGVIEHAAAELLDRVGVGARMRREGLVHSGINLRFAGRTHRVDFAELVGRTVVVYGQQEVVKDLIAARLQAGGTILFEAEATAIEGLASDRPVVRFRHRGEEQVLACDFVAGCDGFHGIARASIPEQAITVYERVYPYAWLGILAVARPASQELVYAHHERGFALLSMRSPTLSRLYLQCRPDEPLEEWPDERIWDELETRLAAEDFRLERGPILQKGVTAMRSFVCEPMRFGRLFLAGDAAHIVPPTGAKGMNLAIGDVVMLARALVAYYREGREDLLDAYSALCLSRIWKAQHFSWWMTTMLHRDTDTLPFDRKRQLGELEAVTGSRAALTWLAENYTGLSLPPLPERS
ncbi:4-hydroxybenzoate 3-monooxygenase (NAD(P)H) [bacterium HR40]|nr:4-hydroxybenzoate 3-monooxygenase (NAD(P)H) [bacterium HR40]